MINQTPLQLSLGVSLRDDATFENFYCANAHNAYIVSYMNTLASGRDSGQCIFWGALGVGLTHLLQAMCHHSANTTSNTFQYLPVLDLLKFSADEVCDGLEGTDMVCVDGLDHICGNKAWEQAIFHLFNNLRDAGHTLIFSSHISPIALPIVLPDLKSRLLASMHFRLKGLDDTGKQKALMQRAAARGMELSEEVATFIMRRAPRDMNQLFVTLNRLDEASLQQQRKLTIPFVKNVLRI